uniref:hypothetical protein n=1 Tax=Serratia marcescens TaxID=615 RepID=UPI001CA32C5C
RKEFHHLMPKAFLRDSRQDSYNESCLANFCFISRADNRMLGGSRPSEYRQRMTGNVETIIASHIIPESLFADDYQTFIDERAERLYEISTHLCA